MKEQVTLAVPVLQWMHSRAQRLRQCLTKTRQHLHSLNAAALHPPSLDLDGTRPFLGRNESWAVYLCPAVKIGFVHVYKAAGTTVASVMSDFCPVPLLQCTSFARQRLRACKDALEDLPDYTLFTFVRNPIDRFTSAVYELAQRGLLPVHLGDVLGEEVAGSLCGDDLARSILGAAVLPAAYNPHLDLQVAFLVDRGSVLENLRYVGAVEHIAFELPQLVASLFGFQHRTSDMKTAALALVGLYETLQVGSRHMQKRRMHNTSQEHHQGGVCTPNGDEMSRFSIQRGQLSVEVQRKILDAYRLDSDCLGYLGA